MEIMGIGSVAAITVICYFIGMVFHDKTPLDSSTIPTHPNANGQKLMGEYLAEQLPLVAYGISQVI